MESLLLKVLAAVGISALDAQMVTEKCQIITHTWVLNRRNAPRPTAWWQEVITTSVCMSTPQFSLDRYLISAYSRAFLLLVEGDFFQEDWQETCAGPWLHKMKQIPEAKPYHYLHQTSLYFPWPIIVQFSRQELCIAVHRQHRRQTA